MERMWASRLRWRLRGAWMWPAFAVFTVVDAVVLHELPIAGDGPTAFIPGLLLAGFANLIAVAVVAPALGRLVRRRRPDLPKAVATDYAGTGLIVAISLAVAAGGALHHSDVEERDRDFRAQAAAATAFIRSQAPPPFRAHAAAANTLRLGDDLYRTCAPGATPARAFCVFVETDQDPPVVRRDSERIPNSRYVSPWAR